MSLSTTVRRIAAAAAVTGTVFAASVTLSTPAYAATDFFRLTNVNSGMALTADTAKPFAAVRQQPVNGPNQNNFHQQWSMQTFSGSEAVVYHLRQDPTLCLDLPRDVSSAQQNAGEGLVVRKCDGTSSQRWIHINGNANGPRNIENLLSLFQIGIQGGSTSAGAPAVQAGTGPKFIRPLVASA